MSDKAKTAFWLAVIALILIANITAYSMSRSDCDDQGGKLVRGVFWYECVEAP